jgi:transcriptional regulator with XRE-family HTH domain
VRWWLDRLERWQSHEPDFMTLRQVAGITCKEVAALCGVKEATVRRWEAGSKSPPRAIVLLLHLSGGQLGVLDPAWKDWHIRAGQLWAPHLLGRGFTPEHLKVYEYAFMERDQLRRDLDGRSTAGSIPDRARATGDHRTAISGSKSRTRTGQPNLTTAAPSAPPTSGLLTRDR